MNNTALGAVSNKKENIRFISEAHEKFYYEKLKEVRYVDVYHKALCYCLGISDDTRRNVESIYDFKTGCVKTECLHEGWQTSGSMKVIRMAFNLYPDLARQLMQEAHLPVRTAGNVTQAALGDLIEGTRPDPFGGAQKAKEKPKTREEQLLDEMRRQAEE